MLATVAALVIIFGIIVDLARHVRNRSAGELTRRLLADLDQALARYQARYLQPPAVPALIPVDQPDWPSREGLDVRAQANSGQWVRALRTSGELGERMFGGLPLAIYDATQVRDAWGSPIVLMPTGRTDIGMAPGDKPFFFSAGPDRRFQTREDNLYSYEVVVSR